MDRITIVCEEFVERGITRYAASAGLGPEYYGASPDEAIGNLMREGLSGRLPIVIEDIKYTKQNRR